MLSARQGKACHANRKGNVRLWHSAQIACVAIRSASGTLRTSMLDAGHVRSSGVKRTSLMRALVSANDPERT